MLSRLRLILTGLFLSMALIACSDDSATSNEAAEDTAAPEQMDTTEAQEPDATDEAATEESSEELKTEQDYIDEYGEPDLTQERQIDDLKIVHHEWDTGEAIVSIQVHNDEVAFSQVTPK